jgi:hypothetical protein
MTMDAELTEKFDVEHAKKTTLELLRSEGQLSHRYLKQSLGITDDAYQQVRDTLLKSGEVVSLRCRGGGLKLPAPAESLPEVDEKKIEEVKVEQAALERGREQKDEKADKAEKDLYPYVKQWADSAGYSHVHIVGDNHRRGRWQNPDVVALVVTPLNWLVGQDIEITSIEVKVAIDITSVWQAANYRRHSHYVYLASYQSERELRSEVYVQAFEAAVDLGLGVLTLTPSGQGAKGVQVREINSPRRQAPSVFEIDSFLTDFEDHLTLRHPGRIIIQQQADAASKSEK